MGVGKNRVANIRGGAEFGESWHLAGTKERKQKFVSLSLFAGCFTNFFGGGDTIAYLMISSTLLNTFMNINMLLEINWQFRGDLMEVWGFFLLPPLNCGELMLFFCGERIGLLVAACVNQAPELFGAAIADVCSFSLSFDFQ